MWLDQLDRRAFEDLYTDLWHTVSFADRADHSESAQRFGADGIRSLSRW